MLPAVEKGRKLDVLHFPTKYQALVFRLWESVEAKRLAKVLETDEETIKSLAKDMGLGEQKNLEEWQTRGYISIIRHVWNLLPYEQIYTLLGWDEARLDYVLKEDDFLAIKLGGYDPRKTECEKVLYRPLTSEEKQQTAKIKKTVEEFIDPIREKGEEAPFDFFKDRYKPLAAKQEKSDAPKESWKVNVLCDGVCEFVEDFKAEAKELYGVEFCENAEKSIDICIDIKSDDEEYHELAITENKITLSAATPIGVMRGLYYLLDLANGKGDFVFEQKTYKRKTKVKTRYIYSFCGLYGDVLDKDSRISFPDELLKGYAKSGINGVWIQGVFYTLAPYPFDEKKSEGWEQRLKNLEELTERCARYGIKVYMYINEPRQMPLEFFEKHPELKGTSYSTAAALCSSHPEVQKYLRDTVQTICTKAPLLGGFMCITQSENMTLCYSGGINKKDDENFCPVCKNRKGSEVVAEVLNIMADAAKEVNKDIKFFAYAWAWELHFEHEFDNLVNNLSKNIIVLQVSESQMPLKRGGVDYNVRDYSLSVVGPGEPAMRLWKKARANNLEVAAKVQINNSWECSTAPYLPVYENVINHIQNLVDVGVEHIMLSWTLGGYMSENIKVASAYFFDDGEDKAGKYDAVLNRTYGEYAEKVRKAVSHFCRGFAEYPFAMSHIYKGPSNSGAANILYPKPSGMTSTMTCYPYDDLAEWSRVYPSDILENQYDKLCKEWEKGLEIIKDMPLCEFKDMAFYGYTLFKASLNQIRFYMLRDNGGDAEKMKEIVKGEKELALLAYEIMCRNSTVGYEAANHYYVTRAGLMEKVVNCEYILNLD